MKYGALRNLLMALDPTAFEQALLRWLGDVHGTVPSAAELQAVAIDGKSLRGTATLDQRAMMLIAAFDHETSTVLRQQVVPVETNEQKAMLMLLKELVLTGRVVTADAAHCQPETCQQIVDSGGDYLITVKANQPTLQAAIALEFAAARHSRFVPPAGKSSIVQIVDNG